MNIVLITHPSWMASTSMRHFAGLIAQSMRDRGHEVAVWTAPAKLHHLFAETKVHKWAGYIDQFLFYPGVLRRAALDQPPDTLFVFADQALGPWVRQVAGRPHVIHCHDLLALRSALGLVPEHLTRWSGRIYQRYIRRGFQQGRHFIVSSKKSLNDLYEFGQVNATTAEVAFNGLSVFDAPMQAQTARAELMRSGSPEPSGGMVLHVGANVWYKNQQGVIQIYAAYVANNLQALPLWLITSSPNDPALRAAIDKVPPHGCVTVFSNVDILTLRAMYSLARVTLFPSLAEGFGWPIIEAQACGCLVLTTDAAPMNEIAGPAAALLPLRAENEDVQAWAQGGARLLQELTDLNAPARQQRVDKGRAWTAQFSNQITFDRYEYLYLKVLSHELTRSAETDVGITESDGGN